VAPPRAVPDGPELTASVVHDVNNALMTILGHTALARRHVEGDRGAQLALKAIESVVQQISLLPPFSGRMRHPGKSRVHLGQLAETAAARLRQVAPEGVEVVTEVSDHARLWVAGSEEALRQLVLGMGTLGLDSIPHRGRLVIIAGSTPRAQSVSLTATVEVGEGSWARDAAGETKRVAMSAVHGIIARIVAEHDAQMRVSSGAQGMSVSVEFLPAPVREPDDPIAGELLLLASPNRQVRAIIASALDRIGHVVLQVSDCNQARAAADQHGPDLSMVILDAALPGVAGRDCLQAFRHARPELLTVAFGEDRAPFEGLVTEFLPTPLSLTDLTRFVRETLPRNRRWEAGS